MLPYNETTIPDPWVTPYRTRRAQPSPKPIQPPPQPKPKRNEMPANSEVLKMLLDEESGRMPAFGGVAAMSELQEDRTAQSNSGFTLNHLWCFSFSTTPPTTYPYYITQ